MTNAFTMKDVIHPTEDSLRRENFWMRWLVRLTSQLGDRCYSCEIALSRMAGDLNGLFDERGFRSTPYKEIIDSARKTVTIYDDRQCYSHG
jgi:hypothetical protein